MLRNFSERHRNITKVFENHFNNLRDAFKEMDVDPVALPFEKKLLIGSYFTSEFSIESAAFFNPSMVEDPYQTENIRDDHNDIVQQCDHFMMEWVQEQRSKGDCIPDPVDEILRERARGKK